MANRVDVIRSWPTIARLGLLAGATLVSSCVLLGPPVYFAEPIEARVVDAKTGEPIEGAVVVAAWIPMALSVDTATGSTLHVAEGVTDAEGYFRIPGWGPKFRRPLTSLGNRDPVLTVFKSAYAPKGLMNREISRSVTRHSITRRSDWDGKTIELERFEGTARERYLQIWQIPSSATGSWPATSAPTLLDELLRDETMFKDWAPGDRLFFTNLREIIRARR